MNIERLPPMRVDEMWIEYLNVVDSLSQREREVFIDTMVLINAPPILVREEDLL